LTGGRSGCEEIDVSGEADDDNDVAIVVARSSSWWSPAGLDAETRQGALLVTTFSKISPESPMEELVTYKRECQTY
jgi:hypothetical protein